MMQAATAAQHGVPVCCRPKLAHGPQFRATLMIEQMMLYELRKHAAGRRRMHVSIPSRIQAESYRGMPVGADDPTNRAGSTDQKKLLLTGSSSRSEQQNFCPLPNSPSLQSNPQTESPERQAPQLARMCRSLSAELPHQVEALEHCDARLR